MPEDLKLVTHHLKNLPEDWVLEKNLSASVSFERAHYSETDLWLSNYLKNEQHSLRSMVEWLLSLCWKRRYFHCVWRTNLFIVFENWIKTSHSASWGILLTADFDRQLSSQKSEKMAIGILTTKSPITFNSIIIYDMIPAVYWQISAWKGSCA